MTLVKEIPSKRHGHPTIKDGAVRIFDHKTSRIYVYGGVPWARNPDRDSPTRLASSSFHALEIKKGMVWMDYSVRLTSLHHMSLTYNNPQQTLYYNSLPRRVPFEFLGHYNPEELEHVDLSMDAGLPRLYGASGLLVDDKVSHNRYIIIFGVNKERAEMSLFCVNVTIQKWMYLTLDGEEKKRLRFGSQIALSGVGTDNVLLHVFGGRSSVSEMLELCLLLIRSLGRSLFGRLSCCRLETQAMANHSCHAGYNHAIGMQPERIVNSGNPWT